MVNDFPIEAIRSSQNSITRFFNQATSVGFVINGLDSSQLSYSLLRNIDLWRESHGYENIVIYQNQDFNPVITPSTAIYNTAYLQFHEGNIIACDINGWQATKRLPQKHKFFYVYDPLLLRHIPPEIFNELKANKAKFKFICRSEFHKHILEQVLEIQCIKEFVPNAEIDLIMEIVKKYGQASSYEKSCCNNQ